MSLAISSEVLPLAPVCSITANSSAIRQAGGIFIKPLLSRTLTLWQIRHAHPLIPSVILGNSLANQHRLANKRIDCAQQNRQFAVKLINPKLAASLAIP